MLKVRKRERVSVCVCVCVQHVQYDIVHVHYGTTTPFKTIMVLHQYTGIGAVYYKEQAIH